MNARCRLARIPTMLVSLVMLTIGYGCSRQGWEQIPIKEVRRILPEYTLLAVSLDQRNVPDSQRRAAYEGLLMEQGYTLEDWDSSMAWYARNELMLLHDIYRTTADSMERMQTSLQTRLDAVVQRETYLANRHMGQIDSVNLLSIGSRFYRAGEEIKVDFNFSLSMPYDSTRRVELSTALLGTETLDTLVFPFLELYLHLSDTTTLYASTPLSQPGRHAVALAIPAGKKAHRISGTVRGRMPSRVWWMMQLDSLRLVRYPLMEGAPATTTTMDLATPSLDDSLALEEVLL